MIYAVILADSNKVKLNSNTPIPFFKLNGKPIIIYSVEQFLLNDRIDKIIITCEPNYIDELKNILKKYIKDISKIEVIEGGNTRNESIMNGCNHISTKYGINNNDIIIVHDADRPFINQKIINDNIDNVLEHGAVCTAIPATDTVFELKNNDKVLNIHNQKDMFYAQSPQSFNIKKLVKLFEKLSEQEKHELTDSCKIFILNDEIVELVEGDKNNIKITYENDLNTAKNIINSKNYNGDIGSLPYVIKKCAKNLITSTDWLSIFSLFGIIISFLLLDLGIRYFSEAAIDFYPTIQLSPLLFTLSYITVFIFITYNVPQKFSGIFYGVIFVFFWIYTLAQIIHFKILNKFFVITDLQLVGEASEHLSFILNSIGKRSIAFFAGTLLIGIINIILIKKSRGYYRFFKRKLVLAIVILFVFGIRISAISLLGKAVPETQWDSWNYPKNVYNSYTNQNRSLRVSGIYEYLFRDVYLNINVKISKNRKQLIKIIESYNDELLMLNYIEQNDYNSIFKDKNLIMIMLESIDSWLVNAEDMPTLHNLQNSGWNFINRYAPAFGNGATMNTEFSALTGLHTPIHGNSSYNYSRNLFPYSLPNLFKNEGYIVNSIHFNHGSFYNRTNLHKALGFSNHYALLDIGFSAETTDDRVLVKNDDIYKLIVPSNTQKFMSFVTTYTAHGPYLEKNSICQQIFNNNLELIIDNDWETSCIKELSKITDEFLAILIKRLKEDKLLDKTVLIIFSDHYAYGYTRVSEIKKIHDKNLIQNVPFVIWYNNIQSRVIETIMDSSDITPTVANLFGLNYNSKYYVGTDVFSIEHDNFVYFPDYSWYDGNIYYKGTNISDYENLDYIKKISTIVNKKIELNDAILNSDYYRYLIKDTLR